MDLRSKVILKVAIIIQVQPLQKMTNPRIMTICIQVEKHGKGSREASINAPYVEIGCIDGCLDLCGRIAVTTETGEDVPDLSGDPSLFLNNFECASNNPTAIVLLEPTAGAAFVPSKITLPLSCIRLRGLNDVEFAVETTLSVGLPGRSIVEPMEGIKGPGGTGYGIPAEVTEAGGEGTIGAETRGELGAGMGDLASLVVG
jgi:hypothetical protein